jgi:hypothetical protein
VHRGGLLMTCRLNRGAISPNSGLQQQNPSEQNVIGECVCSRLSYDSVLNFGFGS